MNQSLFLHIVEKLEGLLGKLPTAIQKPILHELTPLKELFLQQRAPRLLLVGPSKRALTEILPLLFAAAAPVDRGFLTEVFRWQDWKIGQHGTVTILDARGAEEDDVTRVQRELERQPADAVLLLADEEKAKRSLSRELGNLSGFLTAKRDDNSLEKIVTIVFAEKAQVAQAEAETRWESALADHVNFCGRLLGVIALPLSTAETEAAQQLMSLLAQNLPNPARVEMIRISRDKAAQASVAQALVKSTTAICAAIGAQPIPLADLPILTTLQLVMVSGIMYLSGRERSLRAATEFMGALGANVGAGMILREGTRAVLKFFPGWGNLVCGMVAGAGTYAIGRAAIVFFIEGVSIGDARRTYLQNRKKSARGLPERQRQIANGVRSSG